ncbi:MAG TPA: hypothetical protein VLC46_24745 [Thermoanaerobaculia bacterium]|jgi:uncharacterized repeat protein (TIGR04076 family)|nr:hypothetical protein [Thermoanaerobaculia bacterium]
MSIITFIVGMAVTTAALANDPQATTTGSPGAIVATFCQGEYALCIKAPCAPIVTRKPDGTFSIEEANCTCDVLTGWSMGPLACDKRAPVTVSGHTYLMSTYSNFFNKTNLTLSCPSSDQVWALCYGAPCVVDEKNPSKSTCTCPIRVGPSMTLGGECRQEACKSIWSAATPSADTFANNNYFNYMTENKLQPPPNPPAKACPDTSTQK